jgi:hypothetical protein
MFPFSAIRAAFAVLSTLALAGCITTGGVRDSAVPEAIADIAAVPGALATTVPATDAEPIRYWGDEQLEEGKSFKFAPGPDGAVDFLSLSGGGINGAYGAGFLVGWTQTGKRPEFEVVTGISVGALIAPMAFLGPSYDGRLTEVFSSLASQKSPNLNFISAALGAPSIASNAPVLKAIRRLIDPATVMAIAVEHLKGRRLLIGTTNLDAERPVIWDIGAIAASNIPNRLDLIQQILLASAAVPGVYPPVLIDVRAAGGKFDELHVDGGVTQQIVLLPDGLDSLPGRANLYVIYNGAIEPSSEPVNVTSLSVLERAIPTLLKYRGRGDIAILTNLVERSGIKYRLTAIPPNFPQPANTLFGGPEWLAALYQYGVESGSVGAWHRSN